MIAKPETAVFFDRDGVLNVDHGYMFEAERLEWIEGAMDAVKAVNQAGALVIVVTNQSGIGRGYFGEAEMHAFHQAMNDALAKIGARIDAFYFCPFHEDAALESFRVRDHPDRKPNPGMLLRAMADFDISPRRAVMIGDKPSDLEAAERAGIEGVLFDGGSLAPLVSRALSNLATRAGL